MSEIPPYRPDPLSDSFTAGGVEGEPPPDPTHQSSTSMFGDPFGGLLGADQDVEQAADQAKQDAFREAHRLPDPDIDAPPPPPTPPARPAAPAVPATPAPRVPDPAPRSTGPTPPAAPLSLRRGRTWHGGATRSPWTGRAQGRLRASGCGPKVGFFIALFVLGPILLGLVGIFAGDSADPDETPDPSVSVSVEHARVPVKERAVPVVPVGATAVRVEIQGAGHAPDVTLSLDGDSTRLRDVTLPYAVELPVSPDTNYVSVRATDYEAEGGTSMQCRAYAGEVLVALNTGTDRVECIITSSSLPTD